jgi:hypothetical protein
LIYRLVCQVPRQLLMCSLRPVAHHARDRHCHQELVRLVPLIAPRGQDEICSSRRILTRRHVGSVGWLSSPMIHPVWLQQRRNQQHHPPFTNFDTGKGVRIRFGSVSLLVPPAVQRNAYLWPASRLAFSGCTSGAAGEGRVACGGQAKPYRLPGPCGAGTPGSRWRGNPGLWKSSPTGNVRDGRCAQWGMSSRVWAVAPAS